MNFEHLLLNNQSLQLIERIVYFFNAAIVKLTSHNSLFTFKNIISSNVTGLIDFLNGVDTSLAT